MKTGLAHRHLLAAWLAICVASLIGGRLAAQSGKVDDHDRLAPGLDPAARPQRPQRLGYRLSRGPDPAGQVLLGEGDSNSHPVLGRLAEPVGEFDETAADPSGRVGGAELHPLAVGVA